MNIDILISDYARWIKERISIRQLNDWYEISTPFLNHNNDLIQIYAKKEDRNIILSDGGDTLNELALSGIDIDRSEKRVKEFNSILNGFGVNRSNDELTVVANENTFPEVKHRLVQAIMSIDDMFLLAEPKVESFFLEDLTLFFDLNDVRYISNVSFLGKSGFYQTFDFSIPKSKNYPERIVKAVNTPRKDIISNIIWSYEDTTLKRQNSEGVVILNDEKKVDESVFEALNRYDLKPIRWTERKNYVEYLRA
jgi:hypothetical protein